jgi:hypothetical protein
MRFENATHHRLRSTLTCYQGEIFESKSLPAEDLDDSFIKIFAAHFGTAHGTHVGKFLGFETVSENLRNELMGACISCEFQPATPYKRLLLTLKYRITHMRAYLVHLEKLRSIVDIDRW